MGRGWYRSLAHSTQISKQIEHHPPNVEVGSREAVLELEMFRWVNEMWWLETEVEFKFYNV